MYKVLLNYECLFHKGFFFPTYFPNFKSIEILAYDIQLSSSK